MTITAVGSLVEGSRGSNTLAVSPTAIGDILVLGVSDDYHTGEATAVSGGGVTTWAKAVGVVGATYGYADVWWGVVTATGAATITATAPDTTTISLGCQQFTTTDGGVWKADGPGATWTLEGAATTMTFNAPVTTKADVLAFGVGSCQDANALTNGNGAYVLTLNSAYAAYEYCLSYTNSTGANVCSQNGSNPNTSRSAVALFYKDFSPGLAATFAASITETLVAPDTGNVAATFAANYPDNPINVLPAGNVATTFDSMITTSAGFSDPSIVPWMLPVSINDHAYMMDFLKSRITTMQIRRQASDESVEPGEQCVDETTEILTRRGWILHDDLRVGDVALTLNMASGLSEWNVVEDVKRYARRDFTMWSMEGRGHSSLTTLNHRWPVERSVDHGKSGKSKEIVIRTSEELNTKHSIIAGAECASLPTEAKYTDELVELVAWFWTEGNTTLDHRKEKVRRVTIAQHPRANPEKVERIRACLTRAFGPEHRGVWYEYENPHNGVSLFHIQRGVFDEILDAAPNKVVRPEWLASLTKAQLELFIEVSVLADGWRQGRHVALSQASRERVDAFQFACVLAGRRTNRIYEKAPMSSAGWRWKVSASNTRKKFNPVLAARKARAERTSQREMNKSAFEITTVKYDGIVWCPKTENETWCARRDGHVYFTGNTLSAAGVWPRAQDNYFLGAGQEFLDNRFAFESVYVHSGEYPSVRTRFWKSQGINPWSEGKMSLLPEYASIATSATELLIIACGNYLYRTDGASLYWTLSPVGVVSPTWTKVTTTNTNTILSLATDGSRVWFACGSQGVYVTSAGTTSVASAATPAALPNIGGLLAYAAGAGTLGAYLTAGSTTYNVTKVDAFGNETALTAATVTVGTTPINLNWQPDTNASKYNVYRGSSTLIYSGTDPSFVDDGTVQGSTRTAPVTNGTGTTAYAATFIAYAKGHLIGSTGRDLVEILASGSVSFIFQHENPGFVFTCATECPTAILVGGYAGGTSYVGAIQPDAATNGATLAPPTWATTLTPGEQINAISYDAGAILLGTNLGIRSGTKPDSTGAFDVNPVIEDMGSVLCVASWSQYEYFGWSNYNPSESWAGRSTVSGLGRADLSQYTTPGVPAYATDVMGAGGGLTTQVLVMSGVPYFVVNNSGAYTLYGPDGKVVSSGWFEPGWIRYGTLENKIVVEVDFQHEPLPSGASVNYKIVAEDMTTITNVGTNSAVGSTTLKDPFSAGLMVGDRFMPIITLTAATGQATGPVFHSHITKAMVTTKRQDEILMALIWADEAATLGEAQKTAWLDCWTEYEYLKALEASGQTINLTMGSMVKVAYVDQVMLEPTDMNASRTFFQGTLTVKVVTLS